MILAAVSIKNPNYVPTSWQTFLLTVLLMLVHSCMASLPTKWLAKINSVGSSFNMIALIVVIILIPSATNRQDQGLPRFKASSEVWGSIYEGADYTAGVRVLMSFVSYLSWYVICYADY